MELVSCIPAGVAVVQALQEDEEAFLTKESFLPSSYRRRRGGRAAHRHFFVYY